MQRNDLTFNLWLWCMAYLMMPHLSVKLMKFALVLFWVISETYFEVWPQIVTLTMGGLHKGVFWSPTKWFFLQVYFILVHLCLRTMVVVFELELLKSGWSNSVCWRRAISKVFLSFGVCQRIAVCNNMDRRCLNWCRETIFIQNKKFERYNFILHTFG